MMTMNFTDNKRFFCNCTTTVLGTVKCESVIIKLYTCVLNRVSHQAMQYADIYTFKLFVDQQPSFWSVLIYLSLFVKRSFCLYISDRNYSLTVYISNLFAVSVPFSNILWQGISLHLQSVS